MRFMSQKGGHMIVTLCYWGLLFCLFFAVGWCGQIIARGIWKQEVIESWDSILMTGIVLSTLYAETASLFFPLGAGAALGLLASAIGAILVWHKEMVGFFRESVKHMAKGSLVRNGVMLLFFALLAAFWTCFDLCDFDNLNYHAQSIRWLEEYGVVKGLGNLHTRLAYNSAFFALQAIFSFAWMGKMSLHSLNGFLWVFAMYFCGFGWAKENRTSRTISLSSIFRVFLFLVVARRGLAGATPTVDFLPLFLTGYVFIKWCELNENKNECTAPYALLGILCVFCVTVKLSAAMLAFFCLKPLVNYASKRNWREMVGFLAGCGVVLTPFLVRNVLLSGWLVYPCPWLDWVDVDWKVPSLSVISEVTAIRAYALFGETWDWRYIFLQDTSVSWFAHWLSTNSIWGYMAVGSSVVFYVVWGGLWLRRKVKRRGKRYDTIVFGTAFVGFSYMMLTAPSLRFGIWWMFAGLAMTCWMFVDWMVRHCPRIIDESTRRFALRIVPVVCLVYASVVLVKLCGVAWGRKGGVKAHLLWPCDYADTGATAAWKDMGGQRFYYHERTPDGPGEGWLNGYHGFPGTEYRTMLELIELRGESLSDGFRRRSDTQSLGVDFRGRVLDAEELRLLGRKP